jgi:hypothetical protein
MLLLQLWCETVTWSSPCYRTSPGATNSNSNGNIPFFKVKDSILYFKKGNVTVTVTVSTTWAGTVTWRGHVTVTKTLVFLEGARDFPIFNRVGHCSVSCVCLSQNIEHCSTPDLTRCHIRNRARLKKCQYSSSYTQIWGYRLFACEKCLPNPPPRSECFRPMNDCKVPERGWGQSRQGFGQLGQSTSRVIWQGALQKSLKNQWFFDDFTQGASIQVSRGVCNWVQKIILVDPVSNSMVCDQIQFSSRQNFLVPFEYPCFVMFHGISALGSQVALFCRRT